MAGELTRAEEAAVEQIADGVRKSKKPQPIPAAEMPPKPEPEPFDPEAELRGAAVDVWTFEGADMAALREFAHDLWERAYNQGAEDVSSCCGCTGKHTPNPFDDKEADNG